MTQWMDPLIVKNIVNVIAQTVICPRFVTNSEPQLADFQQRKGLGNRLQGVSPPKKICFCSFHDEKNHFSLKENGGKNPFFFKLFLKTFFVANVSAGLPPLLPCGLARRSYNPESNIIYRVSQNQSVYVNFISSKSAQCIFRSLELFDLKVVEIVFHV